MTDNKFDFTKFKMLWGCYYDDIVNGNDLDSYDNKELIAALIYDNLKARGFTIDEVSALLEIENDGVPTIDPDIWTHFCAAELYRIKPFDTYEELCNVIDEEFNCAIERHHMPESMNADDRDPLIVKVLEWSKKI